MRQTIIPKDKQAWLSLRLQDVTSTEVSALFGLSPYLTELELYHQKKNQEIVDFDIGERGKWGSRLESSIAGGIAEDLGLEIRHMKEYIRIEELRMGASFDYAIGDDGILEIKNVDNLVFLNQWEMDDEEKNAPPHIEMQVQAQLAISGRKFAYIGALVGGNRVELIKREPDWNIIKKMELKVKEFWHNIENGIEPKPNFSRDAAFISQLYKRSEPDSVLYAKDKPAISLLAVSYQSLGEQIKFLQDSRDEVKARLLVEIGGAEKVFGENFTISAKTTEATRVEAFDRKAFRNFRVNFKKEKK